MAKNEGEKIDVFTKKQVLSSKQYEDKKDVVSVILEDSKYYSIAEVDALVDKFMKREVK